MTSDAPMFARYADWVWLFGLSLVLGLFSPRIFVRRTWSAKERGWFTGAVTVLLFFIAGIYRFSSGQEITEQVQKHLICSWWHLAHCSDQLPVAAAVPKVPFSNEHAPSVATTGVQAPPALSLREGSSGGGVEANERSVEIDYWDSIKGSKSADDFVDYLAKYPNGVFASIARRRIAAIKSLGLAASTALNANSPPTKGPENTFGETEDSHSSHAGTSRSDSTTPNMLQFTERPTNYDERGRPNN